MGFIIRGGGGSGTGTGGTTDHNALTNKNLPNQHSIEAITGLLEELGKRPQTTDVNVMINSIVNGAPEAYNTLKEIADYIAQDQSAGASILASLVNKVDKEAGKGLSSNDYTNIDKGKVHDHANTSVLGKIGESTGGNITYNGVEINSSGGGGSSISYQQLTKLNAAANDVVEIPITATTTFALAPLEVLKFISGSTNQVLTSCEFNLADSSKFVVSGNASDIIFDGNMYPQTNFSFNMVKDTSWTATGQYCEDTSIDDTQFKTVKGATIT